MPYADLLRLDSYYSRRWWPRLLITLVTHKWKGVSAALSIGAIALSFALSMGLFLVFAVKPFRYTQPHTIQWLVIGNTVRMSSE